MRAATFLGAAILAALMSSGCGRGTPPQTPEPQGRASSSDAAASPSAPAPTRLTLTYDKGICNDRPDDRAGVYTVVVSRISIHFTRLEDTCERRTAIDGQTWWRIK